MQTQLKPLVRQVLPAPVRRWILLHTRRPPVGRVHFGDLRRVTPVSRDWGGGRGLPVDRYYVEQFLGTRQVDIRGRVLEVGNNVYTRRFGGDRVITSDILDVDDDNPKATFVADLTRAEHIPSDIFDCIICTQTLQLIFDLKAAIRTLHRILKPGGVLLVTVPGISQIARPEMDLWGDFWRFTELSARYLFEDCFPAEHLEVKALGNVLAAVAFLHGLVAEELDPEEFDHVDDDYQLLITIRAHKPG
jgi:SAM-dependent methyltransferase